MTINELPALDNEVTDNRAYRLTAIDALRGLVIVIMALDHVRDFFMAGAVVDPTATSNLTLGLFATRWITHFCAPVFVLLAGTSAGLMMARRSRTALVRFLLTRGVWLVVVDVFVISTALTFAPGGLSQFEGRVLVIMQVLSVIGVGMIVLSVAQWTGRRGCLAIGALIIVLHNSLDPYWPASDQLDEHWPVWIALHSQMSLGVGPFLVIFVYPALPWVAVILLGFGLAEVFELQPSRRNAILWMAGIMLTMGFLALRMLDGYGDPSPWRREPSELPQTLMGFLSTTKYPPSLLFLLMTLGPASVACACIDRVNDTVKKVLVVFGRVPFTFYVVHFFLIHSISVLLGVIQGFEARQLLTHFLFYPAGYGVPLIGVYFIWIVVVLMMYPICHSMAKTKSRRRDWWLSYL